MAMKAVRYGSVVVVMVAVIGGLATAQAPRPQPSPQQPPVQRQGQASPQRQMPTQDPATVKDIENTLGFVPQWLRQLPTHLLPAFWNTLKSFQMSSETALDNKTKELIGLAVASQIPCEYCVAFHTEVARMNGASDQEIQEAVGMAAVTREGSTLLNGLQIDKAQFKRDLDRMVRGGKKQAQR
jgi:AhpD family alkylhydroperoxidase